MSTILEGTLWILTDVGSSAGDRKANTSPVSELIATVLVDDGLLWSLNGAKPFTLFKLIPTAPVEAAVPWVPCIGKHPPAFKVTPTNPLADGWI